MNVQDIREHCSPKVPSVRAIGNSWQQTRLKQYISTFKLLHFLTLRGFACDLHEPAADFLRGNLMPQDHYHEHATSWSCISQVWTLRIQELGPVTSS